jgi:thioredoxin 2
VEVRRTGLAAAGATTSGAWRTAAGGGTEGGGRDWPGGALSLQTVPCRSCDSPNRVEPERLRQGLEPVCDRCGTRLPVSAVPVDVTDATFDAEVLSSVLPVLLDVWAPWCVPCRGMEPVVEEIASTFAARIRVARLNLDKNPEAVTRLRIQGIPTLMIFEDGREVTRMIGLREREELLSRLSPVA